MKTTKQQSAPPTNNASSVTLSPILIGINKKKKEGKFMVKIAPRANSSSRSLLTESSGERESNNGTQVVGHKNGNQPSPSRIEERLWKETNIIVVMEI